LTGQKPLLSASNPARPMSRLGQRCRSGHRPATFTAGTRVTSCPPHRSVRTQFRHTAPTSVETARGDVLTKFRMRFSACDTVPRYCARPRALLIHVPPGPSPWFHQLRSGCPAFVRRLQNYYGGIRVLTIVHHRLRPLAFPTRTSAARMWRWPTTRSPGSRVDTKMFASKPRCGSRHKSRLDKFCREVGFNRLKPTL
jgi:hypothetical protein